jgi:hypothetical protein
MALEGATRRPHIPLPEPLTGYMSKQDPTFAKKQQKDVSPATARAITDDLPTQGMQQYISLYPTRSSFFPFLDESVFNATAMPPNYDSIKKSDNMPFCINNKCSI